MRSFFSILLLITLFVSSNTSGQKISFDKVDSFAIHFPNADTLNVPQLTYALTDPFNDPVDKARAIYTWIAHNIAYDCPAFHSESRQKNDAADVLKLRRAVCAGYSNLFLDMCSYANIRCLTIDGYARNGSEEMGEKMDDPNHTWNAVSINGQWKMVDVTWASGYTDKKVKTFTKQFSGTYFFTDPNKFILNHYPKLDAWKPAKLKMSKEKYFDNPAILEGYFVNELVSFEPQKGIIKLKPGESAKIAFQIPDAENIKRVTVVVGEEKKSKLLKPDYNVSGSTVSFNLEQELPGVYPFTIYLNDIATLSYQLQVD